MSHTEKKEQSVLWLSFYAGLLFAAAEFVFSIFSGSQSALMDAVYDASELVFIVFILFLTPLFYKPISEKYPYGFFQIESIILMIKGVMMLSVTFSVSADIIGKALSGGNHVNATAGGGVSGGSGHLQRVDLLGDETEEPRSILAHYPSRAAGVEAGHMLQLRSVPGLFALLFFG